MINLVLALSLAMSLAALAFSVWMYIPTKRESRKMQSLVEQAFWRNRSKPLNAADLFPEFQQRPTLVDGERYVLAKQPVQDDGGALHVTSVIASYRAEKDSWRFSDGLVAQRREADLWIKESDYPAALERSHERMLQRVAAESKALSSSKPPMTVHLNKTNGSTEFISQLNAQIAGAPNESEMLGQLAYAHGYLRALRDQECFDRGEWESLTLEIEAERAAWLQRNAVHQQSSGSR